MGAKAAHMPQEVGASLWDAAVVTTTHPCGSARGAAGRGAGGNGGDGRRCLDPSASVRSLQLLQKGTSWKLQLQREGKAAAASTNVVFWWGNAPDVPVRHGEANAATER